MTDYQPDILNFLEKIVQRNTIAYKEDFDVDKEIFWNPRIPSRSAIS